MKSRDLVSSARQPPYIGRFAPSPTGPLHMGSLLCAVVSFIDARRHHGQWKLRIEDLDPPREDPNAASWILRCLDAHGLTWDGEVLYQSSRVERYRDQLDQWLREALAYRCSCTRQRLAGLAGTYDGHCRHTLPSNDEPAALRVKVTDLPPPSQHLSGEIAFSDRIQGDVRQTLRREGGDFIIHRKDGYHAYVLAGVLDEIEQGVTEVVRGYDLLGTTARQQFLFKLLQREPPRYAHFPVLLDRDGRKLSKQNHAPAVDNCQPVTNLRQVLGYLGFPSDELLGFRSCTTLLEYAVARFRLESLRGRPAGIAACPMVG